MTTYDFNKSLMQKKIPTMSYDGGDLAVWQENARTKLRELLHMEYFQKVDADLKIEYENKIEGATEIRFTFRSEEDYRVPCHLLLPDGIENPPLMMCVQGHSTGMHISMGRTIYEHDEASIQEKDEDFAVQALREGFAAVTIEQRNFGEVGVNADSTGLPRCLESSMTALLLGKTTIGERVWDISRLIDVLEDHFADKMNLKDISCIGQSGGGTAIAYAGALEERINFVISSGAMCTFKDSIGAMAHCACNYVPGIAEYFDMDDLMAMACPKYFVQVNGINDPIFPLFGAEEVFEKGKKAYEKAGVGERCALVKGDGGHRFYAEDTWPVVRRLLGK